MRKYRSYEGCVLWGAGVPSPRRGCPPPQWDEISIRPMQVGSGTARARPSCYNQFVQFYNGAS